MDIPETDETAEQVQNRDLRAELFQELSSKFAASLNSTESIPAAARKALIEILDTDAATAADIVTAASKNDPDVEELTNE